MSAALANSVSSARIEAQNSDRLIVEFTGSVEFKDTRGFRLTGGATRIEKLLSGNGSSRLVFQLTDYALPEDNFTLLHWQDMSSATIGSKRLPDIERNVTNGVRTYQGSGKLYYVSTSGSDRNSGRSSARPFRTFKKAHAVVQPGDFILMKRGDVWDRTNVVITKSGTANKYITVGAYGTGKRPIIYSRGLSSTYKGYRVTGATLAIQGADYVQIDNLHIKTDISAGGGGADDGIQLLDCKYAVVSNCIAEAPEPGGYFGIRVNTWVYDKQGKEAAIYNNTYPQVLNCEAFGYLGNMGTQIWPYDGRHTIKEGGTIENCISRDPVKPKSGGNVWENLMINRGNFNGFVIRKNKVFGFRSNGLETFGSQNVIVEYNEVYDPADYDRGGKAIKAGGYNSASQTAPGVGELYSDNIIVRYNKVYNITRGNTKDVNAIDVNNSRSGEVYGNLVYNVKGVGIKITGKLDSKGWRVYNNTVVDCGEDAIQLYTDGSYAANVSIKNNILQGASSDIRSSTKGTSKQATGQNNLLLGKGTKGSYAGQKDVKRSAQDLFVNASKRDYRLKKSSLAINKGVRIDGFKKGIAGNLIVQTPDLGAYQFADGTQPTPAPAPSPPPTPSPEPQPEPTVDNDHGLRYRHYHGSWKKLPDFGPMKAVKTGVVSNFTIAPSTKEEFFGFLYEGYVKIERAGKYTFYTTSDDGSKLWIDGQVIVDNDGLHAKRERLGVVYLTQGFHEIRVSFFDGAYAEALQVSYKGPSIAKQSIPNKLLFLEKPAGEPKPTPAPSPSPTPTPPSSDNGLRYRHYHGSWKKLPDFGPMKAVKTGVVSNFTIAPSTKEEFFGFLYEGYVKIERAGKYTFYTTSDDGSKLWIDGQVIVDNDGLHAKRERLGVVYLTQGFHEIRVSFFDGAYAEALQVSYKGPSIAKQSIPNKLLFLEKPAGEPKPTPAPVAESPVNAFAGSDKQVMSDAKKVKIRGWGIGPNPFRQYFWEKVSGPSIRMEDQNTANAGLYDLKAGTYTFRFTATDSKGHQASDEMVLTVGNHQASVLATQATKVGTYTSEVGAVTENGIRVFPNPIKDVISVVVDFENANLPFSLFDQYGHLMHEGTINTELQDTKIDLIKTGKKFEAGVYILKIYSQYWGVQSFRLLKD